MPKRPQDFDIDIIQRGVGVSASERDHVLLQQHRLDAEKYGELDSRVVTLVNRPDAET